MSGAKGGRGGMRAAVLSALVACLALAALVAIPSGTAGPAPRLVTISTGSPDGVYYYAGGSLCALINAGRWEHGIRCAVRPSGGSIDNLNALRRGDATFAIVQSDWQSHALNGTDVFAGRGPDRALRSIVSLYPESFTVIARSTSGIARFADLAGKRISIGPIGSGGRATMEAVMAQVGWTLADFGYLADYASSALEQALCSGDIDAAVMVIGHPNLTVEGMMASCDLVLVPMEKPQVEQLAAAFPYYFATAIPGGTYKGQVTDVETFALAATLVTSASAPPVAVNELVRSLSEGLTEFQSRHPAFAEFDRRQMLTEGLTAPIYGTARRFFDEAGWLEP